MTITITGLPSLQTQPLHSSYGSFPQIPFSSASITDTDPAATVSVTVTQGSFIHTDPKQADDVKLPVALGSLSSAYSQVVIDAGSGAATFTAPITRATSEYQPSTSDILSSLRYFPSSALSLKDSQVIESDFTVTVSGAEGAATQAGQQIFFTNPVSFSLGNIDPVSHSAQVPVGATTGLPRINLGFGTGSDVTITVSETTTFHSDPGQADDQVTTLAPGTWSHFSGTTGEATNLPTVDANGTITVQSDSSGTSSGVQNPVTGVYAPHAYRADDELNNIFFTPAAQKLTGNQTLQTVFTYTVADTHGDSEKQTATVTYSNPTNVKLLSNLGSPEHAAALGSTVFAPFTLSMPYMPSASSLTQNLTVTQQNLVHTHYGASDDQVRAVGPGVLKPYVYSGDGIITNPANVDTLTGTLTASGPVSPPYAYGQPHAVSPTELLSSLQFTPPAVALSDNEVLETRFTVSLQDDRGDSGTTSVSDFFKAASTSASGVAGGTTGTAGGNGAGTRAGGETGPDGISGSGSGGSVPITPTTTVGAVYRFFDTGNGTHFLTSDQGERDTILRTRPDLVEETNGFGGVSQSSSGAVAVYRFFDSIHGTHFFTSDLGERNTVQSTRPDLVYEASATFYEKATGETGDVAVYRLFDTKLGTHFYTGDASEYAGITSPGGASYRPDLVSEGVSFYAPAGTFR